MAPLGPAPQMTKEWLRAHCRANKLYVTPSLNDTLHLHYQGFNRIRAAGAPALLPATADVCLSLPG